MNDTFVRSAWRARQGRTAAHGAAVSGMAAECEVCLSLLVVVRRKMGKGEAAFRQPLLLPHELSLMYTEGYTYTVEHLCIVESCTCGLQACACVVRLTSLPAAAVD